MADSNVMALRYLEEVTWGDTPASPGETIRPTSATLAPDMVTVESAEIISDRQLSAQLITGISGRAEAAGELSYATWDKWFSQFLCDPWQTGEGLAGALVGTDLLENGVTPKSMTLEGHFTDITQFLYVKGLRLGTLSLNIALDQIVTLQFTGIAKEFGNAVATVFAGTPVAATGTLPLTCIDISGIMEGGLAVTGVTGITLNLTNNLRAKKQLGSTALYGVGYGGFRGAGTATTYFENNTILTKVLARTRSSFQLTLTDTAGNAIEVQLPRVFYSGVNIPNPGVNQDVMQELPITLEKDPTTGKMFRMTRNPA